VLINADVQGALNIAKKAIPKAFSHENVDEIENVGLHPRRVSVSGKGLCDTLFVENGVVV